MDNTLESKAKFFALYWGQKVLCNTNKGWSDWTISQISLREIVLAKSDSLELTPLSQISDEDAIKVAQLSHQMPNANFIVERVGNDLVHLKYYQENIKREVHISINKYGCINSNWHFLKDGDDEAKSFKINIGEIQTSIKNIPYISIVDFLRSKGYALPWMGLSVEEMIEFGWIKLN